MKDFDFFKVLFINFILPIGGTIAILTFLCCCFDYSSSLTLNDIRYCSNCGYDLLGNRY